MNVLYKKIGIVLLSFTLILLSVIPVFVDALGAPALNPGAPTGATTQVGPTASSIASAVGTGAGWLAGALFDLQGNFLRIPLFFTMKILAGILGIVGLILDEVMFRTVVNFSEAIKAITAINSVWATIRDLGNMAFIFILLYHGIRMVLGVSSTDIKKVIVGIITAALLVNFSLFVTKAIIDASNIATLGFYNSIAAAGGNSLTVQTTNQQEQTVQEISRFGFSGAFMKPLGITGLFDSSGFEKAFSFDQGGKIAIVYIGSIIFMLITIFVFLAVSVLFIIRFVAFVILLIMSPLAFLALAIPGLEPMKDKYWNTLWSQALFGPLYMFYSWIILRLMGPGGITGSNTKSLAEALAAPTVDSVSVIINFAILIALLLMSIIEAKKQATKGGFITNKIIDRGTGYVGGAIFGGAARAGTQTIGRLGRAVADSNTLRDRVREGGVRGWMAKKTLQTGRWTADASFDLRNAPLTLGDKLNEAGAGKGLKGGYDAYLNAKKKEDKALLDLIKPSDRAVAQAEATLKSDEFKDKEKRDRDDYFTSDAYAQVVATEKAKRQKALDTIQKDIKATNEKLGKATTELANITQTIESSTAYTALQARLAAATSEDDRKAIEKEIEEARAPITLATTRIDAVRRLLDIKNKEKGRAEKELNENFDKWQRANYESWISEEQQRLIAIKGGQDEKKYSKKENADLAGQIKIREVTSKTDEYAKAIGERIGKQKTAWFFGVGIPEFSKDRGRALKKGIKKKKSIEDTIKEQVKEEGDDGDGEAPQTPPPPATPTPAP